MKNLQKITPKIVLVFVVAILLFNFPILAIFNEANFLLGLPSILVYIFIVWALVIGALFVIFNKKES